MKTVYKYPMTSEKQRLVCARMFVCFMPETKGLRRTERPRSRTIPRNIAARQFDALTQRKHTPRAYG